MASRRRKEEELLEMVPPQDIEAERAVLGSMLIEEEAVITASCILRKEDFYREIHRQIYQVMLEIYEEKRPVDLITLSEHLEGKKLLEPIGRPYLKALVNSVPTVANVEHYTKIVKEKATRRLFLDIADKIRAGAYNEREEIEELMGQAEEMLFHSPEVDRITEGLVTEKKGAIKTLEELLKRDRSEKRITGLETGFQHLDEVTNGLETGLYILMGVTSCGKTSLAKQLADRVAELNNIPCLYYSLEQSKFELGVKSISRLNRIDSRDLIKGRINNEQNVTRAVAKYMDGIGKYLYLIEADAHTYTSKIRAQAYKAMKEHNTKKCFIVIDYLQILPTQERYDTDKRKVDIVVTELRRLSRDLNSPVLAVSSVNRASYEALSLGSAKETGSIEFTADLLMGLEKDKDLIKEENWETKQETEPNKRNVDLMQLRIFKNRNGELATIKLVFEKPYSNFIEKDVSKDLY